MASTINKIGMFLFECVTTEKIDRTVKQRAEAMIPKALNMAIKSLDQNSYAISLAVVETLTTYLSVLKKTVVCETHMATLQSLFQIVTKRIIYPSWYSFDQESDPNSMEEHYNQFRNGMTVLFVNMVEIKPIQKQIVGFVAELVASLKGPAAAGLSVHQKEVPLHLFYHLGAAVADGSFKLDAWGKSLPGDERWAALERGMNIILTMPELLTVVPLLNITFEIIVRYAGYFEAHPEALLGIIKTFTSDLYYLIQSELS